MREPLRFPRQLLLIMAALLAAAPLSRANEEHVRLLEEAWRETREHFYDRGMHGVDWREVRERYRPRAREATSTEQLHGLINEMLAELGASHCVLLEKYVYRNHFANEFRAQRTLQAGLQLAQYADGYFVASVLEGGPAERAGVLVGDRVLRLDGEPPEQAASLLPAGHDPAMEGPEVYVLRVAKGEELYLEVQRLPGGEAIGLSIEPALTSMARATYHSVRVMEVDGERLGYIHLWHFLSSRVAVILERAIRKKFADCDGLLLDLRGRGGSVFVMNRVLAVFREGKHWVKWRKPVVLLIDGESRSAKEVFAYLWKKEKLGPVVGQRTPGAVLGSQFFPLSDGSVLMLPVMDVRGLTDGRNLEGIGVAPDIEVQQELPYRQGRDALLEKGLEVLQQELFWSQRA